MNSKENNIKLSDLIDIKLLQEFQDVFAKSLNVASITVDDKGPITRPSNFTDFCIKFTRGTEEGYKRCNECDINWGKVSAQKGKPVIYPCHSGLMDFAVPIIVNGKHIASILGGQVLTEKPDENKFRILARQLGIDEDAYLKALRQIKIVPEENIKSAAYMLYLVANSISEIGYRNLKLLEKIKRENLYKSITEAMRSSLDIDSIKSTIVNEVGKVFEADRCYFRSFDKRTKKYLSPDIEYLSSDNIASLKNVQSNQKGLRFFENNVNHVKANFKPIIFDVDKVQNKHIKEYLLESNILLDVVVPIGNWEDEAVYFVINYTREKKVLDKENIKLLETIGKQIAIAIEQSKLFCKVKQTAEREALLRQITETIRSSLDINVIKKNLVTEIGKAFKADRCYIRNFDKKNNQFLAPTEEYLSSSDIKSLINETPDQEGLAYFRLTAEERGKGLYPIIVDEENTKNLMLERYLKDRKVKADYALTLWDKEDELSYLVLHYTSHHPHLNEDDLKMLEIIAEQVIIAINQSHFYILTKKQAEREALLRQITETIRSSLNVDETLFFICNETAKVFNIQRSAITVFPGLENAEEYIVKKEYKLSPEIKGFMYAENFLQVAEYWRDQLFESGQVLAFDNIDESNTPDYFKNTYDSMGIKSIIGTSIRKGKDVWGTLVLSEYDKFRHWTEEEKVLLKAIADQVYIAINQAELFETVKQTAYKESVLKEIISDIKLTRNLDMAYDKLLQKIAEIFALNRALFLESVAVKSDELSIKYEYVSEDLSVNHLVFPKVCTDEFLNLIHNLKPLVINDVFQCHPHQTFSFFKKYKIKALLAVPLVKYNKETKVLGFIVLCSEKTRNWTKDEINLIKAISDSVVSVIWEISNFIEIEELKNSFVITLAHDIQVPFVAEKIAFEYLLKTASEKQKPIIEELLDNNKNISIMLNKSVDIYNYESSKKILDVAVHELTGILNESIALKQKYANLKSVKIKFGKIKPPLFVRVDKTEIMKVFNTILENAIDHSPADTIIEIKCNVKDAYVITSIKNEGESIPTYVQEKIFKRYEMAQAIERKIGAGIGLFLAKRIIEAHNGYIWFETSPKGTVFSVSLGLTVE